MLFLFHFTGKATAQDFITTPWTGAYILIRDAVNHLFLRQSVFNYPSFTFFKYIFEPLKV